MGGVRTIMDEPRPGNYEIMFITHLGTSLDTQAAALNHVMKYKNISK